MRILAISHHRRYARSMTEKLLVIGILDNLGGARPPFSLARHLLRMAW